MLLDFDEEDLNNFAMVKNDESENIKSRLKFYQAPEVIVGQAETEQSLAWTIGVMVDELFAGRCFFRKLTEIIGKSSIYILMKIITSRRRTSTPNWRCCWRS